MVSTMTLKVDMLSSTVNLCSLWFGLSEQVLILQTAKKLNLR